MDFVDVILQLGDYLNGVDWRIIGFVNDQIDLSKFSKQETGMKLLPVEYVNQRGDDDFGFSRDVYFPFPYDKADGGFLYLHVRYS